jgi:hypothetical protein
MAIDTQANSVVIDVAEGNQDFPVPFPIIRGSDLVVVGTAEDGAEIKYTQNISYTVAINRDSSGFPLSAEVLFATSPAVKKLTITRIVPITQERRFANTAGYFPEDMEHGLDRLTMIAQQLQAKLDTKLAAPPGQTGEEFVEGIVAAEKKLEREIADRIAAVLALQTAVDAKADQSALAAEIQARIQGDSALQDDIDAEAATRAQADTAEAQTRAQADAAEASTRSAAVLALQEAVANLVLTKLGFPPADNKTYGICNGFFVEIKSGSVVEDGDGFFFMSEGVVYLKAEADPNAPSRYFRYDSATQMVVLRDVADESVPSKFFDYDSATGMVILKGEMANG